MKIVSLTMVGNESEIIESFIRYNSNFIDKMILVSTCCIDNTLTIIRKLIAEGYNVELLVEPVITFEHRYLDNKYMKKVVREEDADLLIPLDADEFLTGSENPRKIMESLALDRIYQICWKNYAMSERDDPNEAFIPRRLIHYKVNFEGNNITKVLVPIKLIIENGITLSTGHHGVIGENVTVEHLDRLNLAHYPAISKEQYLLRIYGTGIRFITCLNRGMGEGSHIDRQISQIEAGYDIYQIANGYGVDDREKIEWEEEPLDLSYCNPDSLQMKYTELAKVNVIHSLSCYGQMMAIKAYNLEMDLREDKSKIRILVYGAGTSAETMLNGLPENCVNIRAYIDSAAEKKFQMFHRRLVIPPEYIRFFSYDCIIISNGRYYGEMKSALIENGVKKEDIHGVNYLFDLMFEEESRR